MARLHYTKPTRAALLDELLAAPLGLAPETTRVAATGTEVWITVPDGVPSAGIDAVVAAHNAAALNAAEKATAAQEATARNAVQGLVPAFLGGTDLTLAQLNQLIRWLVRRTLTQGG